MNPHSPVRARRLAIRTVVVRISRKLRATYRIRTGPLFSRLLLAVLSVAMPSLARALPQGEQLQAGQAAVSRPSANSMVVNQTTDKAVLQWQSFSIGQGQSVQFVQPGASSVVLNRVVGGDLSAIYGSLTANGQVFLINPAGVMFAPGSQVSVGGLVASTLNLSNADFLAGNYSFVGGGQGSVVNQGSLQGKYVVLAGPMVTNAGTINAPGGSVGLLAGSRVSVDPSGAGLVKFSVDAAAVNAVANNSGAIAADGGKVAVLASALSDTLPTVINQTGVIRANSIANENGTIVLDGGSTGVVAVSGTLEAKGAKAGETGGTVQVLGDRVGLMAGAKVDASGDAGGGTVLVGGNFQGKGAERNAFRTYVDKDASIKADAMRQGNGGRVIVWADDITRFHGSISAQGGAQGGHGGFAEVSGKRLLQFEGNVDLSAAQGQVGTLLLDPNDINIVTSGTDDLAGATGDDGNAATYAFAEDSGGTANISPGALDAVGASVTLQATNNITVSNAVNLTTAGAAFTAQAGNNIQVSAPITTNNGNITLRARDTASGAASTNGNVTISASSPINAGTGTVTLSNLGSGFYNVASSTITGGAVVFGSRMNLSTAVVSNSVSLTNEVLLLGASNLLADTATVNVASGTTLNMQTSSDTIGTLNLNGSLSGTGTLTAGTYNLNGASANAPLGTGTINSTGISSISASQASAVNIIGGSLSISGGTSISDTGAVTISSGGSLNLLSDETIGSLAGVSGTVALNARRLTTGGNGSSTTFAGVISGTGSLGLIKTGAGAFTLDGVNTYTGATNISGGTLVLGPGGSIANSNSISNNSTLEIQGNKTIDSITGTGGTALNAHTLTIGDASNTSSSYAGAVSGTGGIIKQGTGTLTLAGTNTYTGSTTVNAGTLRLAGGAQSSTTVTVNSGATLALDVSNALADAATLNISGGTLNMSTFNDTVGSLVLNNGTVGGSGTLTATGGYTLNGGTVNANLGTGTLTQASSTTTLNGTASASTVNMTGGTLQLGGTSNRLTGAGAAIGISAGATLDTGTASQALGGGTSAVSNSGTFRTGSAAVTAASITGTGSASIGGNVTTSGAQSYGSTTLTGNATLQSTGNSTIHTGASLTGNGHDLAIASAGSATLVDATGVGTFTAGTNGTTNGSITADVYNLSGGTVNATLGTGTLNQTANTTVLNGASAATTVNVNGGMLSTGGANKLADAAAVTLSGTGALALGGPETIGSLASASATTEVNLGAATLTTGGTGASTTFAGVLSGAGGGGLTKTGAGTMTLSGANTYAGTTIISGGTLLLDATGTITASVGVTNNGAFEIQGDKTIGSLSGSGTANLNANTLTVGDARNSSGTYSGVISGAGGITKAGTGTLVLTGSSTYTGATTITAGTLRIAGGSVAASSGVANNGTLDLQSSTTVAAISGAGSTSLNANTLTVGDGRNLSSSYAGAISGTGGLTKAGTGTLSLSGASNYSGGTNIADGTLSVASAGGAGTGTINIGLNNTLEVAGVTITNNVTTTSAATLRGAGTAGVSGSIAIAAGQPLAVDTATAGDSLALPGAISGGSVSKTGSGAVTMTGANTYSGATVVGAGTLRVNGTSLSDSAVTSVTTGATLVLTGNETVGSLSGGGNIDLGANTLTSGGNGLSSTYSGVASGTGGLAKEGAGTLTLAGSNTYTGATSVNAGTLALDHPTDTLSGSTAVAVASGATLDVGANTDTVGSLALAGTLAGTGTLTAATYTLDGGTVNANLGAGTLTQASGTSTLNGTAAAGTVNVTGGTLALGSTANRLTAPSNVSIAAGAALNTGTASQSLGTAPVTNDGTLVTGAALSAASIGGTGTASLGGAVTTTGAQNYGGNVTLTAGTTVSGTNVTFSGTVGGAQALTVNASGATTFGGNVAVASLTTDAAGTTAINGGAVTTTGAQTYNDALTVAPGASLTAVGNLAATNAGNVIGSGAQFTVTQSAGTGTLDIAGDFAGSVAVAGSATSINLSDQSAGTQMVVSSLAADPAASVVMSSAGAMQVDAAGLSPVATLSATTQNGSLVFLNSGTLRGGTPGILATGGVTLNVTGGTLNSAGDLLVVNAATPSVTVTGTGSGNLNWLGAPVPAAALASAAGGSAVSSQQVRNVVATLDAALDEILLARPAFGFDQVGQLPRGRSVVALEGVRIRLPRCVGEQQEGIAGCR